MGIWSRNNTLAIMKIVLHFLMHHDPVKNGARKVRPVAEKRTISSEISDAPETPHFHKAVNLENFVPYCASYFQDTDVAVPSDSL